MARTSLHSRDQLFQLEYDQIQRVARMRYGVVWAFIFISIARGAYEIAVREGMEGLPEGLLRSVIPAALFAFLGFPLIKHFARRAEERLRERYTAQPRRNPLA